MNSCFNKNNEVPYAPILNKPFLASIRLFRKYRKVKLLLESQFIRIPYKCSSENNIIVENDKSF